MKYAVIVSFMACAELKICDKMREGCEERY